VRPHLALAKITHLSAQDLMLFGKFEIHG
jgi:hypothetical protein